MVLNYDLIAGDFGRLDLTGMDQLVRVHLAVRHAGECFETLRTPSPKSLGTLNLTIGSKLFSETADLERLHELLIKLHGGMGNELLRFWTNLGHNETVSSFPRFVSRIGISMEEESFVE